MPDSGRRLCSYCLWYRFEEANPDRRPFCDGVMLPEYVRYQDAMWIYEKGGTLQNLLQRLKYRGATALGRELGRALGRRMAAWPAGRLSENATLVPVPLHPARLRKRGFNQAREIAQGIAGITRIPLLPQGHLQRRKNTVSQTGYSLDRRLENLDGAFQLNETSHIFGRHLIVVDDVFTTGATTLQLAGTIRRKLDATFGIITIAVA